MTRTAGAFHPENSGGRPDCSDHPRFIEKVESNGKVYIRRIKTIATSARVMFLLGSSVALVLPVI